VKKFKLKSFGKINLTLNVLKRLNSGYHSIDSLITFCDLHDIISVKKISGLKDKISFSGKFSKGINSKSNTVVEVLKKLRENNFLTKQSFRIIIDKKIPQGSGLGGGSSNAASILNFFNKKMKLQLSKKKLFTIANQIGFDVPIHLEKKNAFYMGKKAKILRINKNFRFNLLVVYPNIICSTKKIYKKNKRFTFKKKKFNFYTKNKKKLIQLLQKENNDLQEIAIELYPEIKKVIDFIGAQRGCCFSRITGSGSACIGIFFDMKSAIYTQKLVKLNFPKYWSIVSKTI
tara:strand:- start:1773 stop:2636 length:864 start_codon:yes stop_codon:yes gene_type:complete